MKTKLIITSFVVILAITFFSFKNIGEKDSSNVALVMTFDGKGDDDGYLILYGDGSTETVPFKIKYVSAENALMNTEVAAKMMNILHEKGYRYSGFQATANAFSSFMVFEKK